MPVTRNFKHTDPHLQYVGNWQGIHNSTLGALATSNDPEASVTFTFPTKALGVRYYGRKASIISVCIDCTLQNPQFKTQDALNQTVDGESFALLFNQSFSPPGINGIMIHDVPNSGPQDGPAVTLDHFEIDVPEVDTSPETQSRTEPVGAIVGGTVGGAVGMLLLCAILFFLWRRRKIRSRISGHVGESGFYPTSTRHGPPKPTPLTQMQSTVPVTEKSSRVVDNTPSHTHPSRSSTGLPSSSRPEAPQRETDAGPTEGDNGAPDRSLPPDYEHVLQNSRSNSRGLQVVRRGGSVECLPGISAGMQ